MTSLHASAYTAALAGLVGFVGLVGCTRDAEPVRAGLDKTATIRVVSGQGRLAGGEVYEIAEWRSGNLPQRGISNARSGRSDESGGFFADFRGQNGGPTLDLSFKGLDRVGELACGEAGTASLELRVDVANTYHASAEAPCRVVIERRADGVIEGRYMATLRHTGNPSDEMAVSGAFRATYAATTPAATSAASAAPESGERPVLDAARAPKLARAATASSWRSSSLKLSARR